MRLGFPIAALGLMCAGGLLVSGLGADYSAPATPARAKEAAKVASQAVAPVAVGTPAGRPAKAARHAADAGALPPLQGKAGLPDRPASDSTRFGVGERNVKRILLDGDRVWVATSGGLIRYTPASDEYRLYDARSGLRSSEVVFLGKVGERIVASTMAGGFSLLSADGERWEHYAAGGVGAPAVVHDVLRVKGGDVWIATRSGAWRVAGGELARPEAWTHFTAQATRGGLPSDRVYGLAEGRDGEVWFATEGGVAAHRRDGWRTWAATHGAGAQATGHGAKGDFVVALATDARGDLWAGTLGGGLARFDGSAWRRYTTEDGLPGNNVFALHRDASGRLWIGTDRGLARMQEGTFRSLTRRDGLYADAVFAVASAPEALWVGSYGGVARLRYAQ